MGRKSIHTAVIGCGMISDIYLKNMTERFENLERSARASLNENRPDFDEIISQMDRLSANVLWQQDWHVVKIFNQYIADPSA